MKLTSKIYAEEILNEIQGKEVILYERDKNLDFVKKYNISSYDIRDIVYSLTANNFIAKIDNKDSKIPVKYLYYFKSYIQLYDEYGCILEYIYIKLCVVNNKIILVVSLHIDED